MKKTKSKNFVLRGTVFPYDCMVSLGQTDDELREAFSAFELSKEDIESFVMCDVKAGLFAFDDNIRVSLIRLEYIPETPKQFGVLQHEILHYVIRVLRFVDVKLCEKSEEVYTYLQDWATREIYKELKA